jgi:formamidopyrimidine-DNA glycosylase
VPELPDVEAFRRHLDREGLHRRIDRVHALDPRGVRDVSRQRLSRSLVGEELTSTSRRGKHLFAATSGKDVLVLHFGMTGHLDFAEGDADPPRHERFRLDLADGGRLSLVDQRRLGFVSLTSDVEAYCAANDLGPDALDLSPGDLKQRVGGGRGGIKSLLMDQRVLAGVGNIYSDEILFQARVDPRRPAATLDENEVRRLHRQLRRVLLTAADRDADPARFPRGWLLVHREDGTACPRCGAPIRKVRLVGRGAFFCPGCQH